MALIDLDRPAPGTGGRRRPAHSTRAGAALAILGGLSLLAGEPAATTTPRTTCTVIHGGEHIERAVVIDPATGRVLDELPVAADGIVVICPD
ncbi:hypothetical protein [Asanoa siamensis]|uniref:Uncharacterized protein n=1 Tax=Asanoa siamensis TaxID=926357 RepID=A0ABQ4CMD7_9ACTN|nr:hypothetical protein [Asanoa siamensis]GIF72435.1 hypothetical protein Asi02nite_19530 [Asanoa siamensis]